jgi:uncharacterized membrane protein required for colicin V production
MNIIDVSLLVALGGFVLAGFWFGVIHMVGSLVGLVFGAIIAGRFYDDLGAWIAPWLGDNFNLAKIIAFAAIFILVTKLVAVLVWIVDKVFKFIAVIPFLKTFNRLLGAALGLVEGTLLIGLLVYFAARFPATPAFEIALRESQLADAFHTVGRILAPLLPAAVRALQSVLS